MQPSTRNRMQASVSSAPATPCWTTRRRSTPAHADIRDAAASCRLRALVPQRRPPYAVAYAVADVPGSPCRTSSTGR
ncbi:hypothetical protein ABW54_07590, partial [Burkholderia cenocepacia]